MTVTYIFRNLNEVADHFDMLARREQKGIDKLPKRGQAIIQKKAFQASYWHTADFLRSCALTGQHTTEELDSTRRLLNVSGWRTL